MGFLIAAVVALVLYQVLVEYRTHDPWVGNVEESRGYVVWTLIYGAHQGGYLDHFYRFMIAGLFIGVLVTLISPFLIGVAARSRPIWWLLVCCSSMAVIGLVGGSIWQRVHLDERLLLEIEYGAGFYSRLAFPVLNFIGLLFVRRRVEPVESSWLQGEN